MKVISHRHTQRPFFQETLDSLKLTITHHSSHGELPPKGLKITNRLVGEEFNWDYPHPVHVRATNPMLFCLASPGTESTCIVGSL